MSRILVTEEIADDVGHQLAEIELDIDFMAGGTKPIEAAVGDFFRHQDARHAPILIRRECQVPAV